MRLTHGVAALVALIVLLVSGCGDDDCPTCPAEHIMTLSGCVQLYTTLQGSANLYMEGSLQSADGLVPDIDSVLFCNEACSLDTRVDYRTGHYLWLWQTVYANAGDYGSGDTVVIEVFAPSGRRQFKTKLLDSAADSVHVLNWGADIDDTNFVDVGTDLTVQWDSIPAADWYMVQWSGCFRDEQGVITRCYNDMEATKGCLVALPEDISDHNGFCYVAVTAFTGAGPLDRSDPVRGQAIQGVVNGFTFENFEIQIGDGAALSASAAGNGSDRPLMPSPAEILRQQRR